MWTLNFMIYDIRKKEISLLQHGGYCVQKDCEALVPLGHGFWFVTSRQTTAEEPGRSARFHTVCHSKKKRGAAAKIEA